MTREASKPGSRFGGQSKRVEVGGVLVVHLEERRVKRKGNGASDRREERGRKTLNTIPSST